MGRGKVWMYTDGIEGTNCRGLKWTRELYWIGKDGNGMGGNVQDGKDVTQMWIWIEWKDVWICQER